MFVFFVSQFFGCGTVDICNGTPPSEATELSLELIVWDGGPSYESSEGTYSIYSTQEEWEAFLAADELTNPAPDVDFSVSDVLLFKRVFNGCDYEETFDGAYLYEGARYVRYQRVDLEQVCDAYFPKHAVLVLEKVEDIGIEVCPLL